jgi:glycine cleavage system H lipoate-binding protein
VVPQDLRRTREREWARATTPNTVRTGHARRSLGDRVFVQLPVHGARAAGRMLGEVESTESDSRTPELINSDVCDPSWWVGADRAAAHGKRAASDYTEYTEQG